jgi:hypothetical protein
MHVFFRNASEERSTMCLLLDVDSVAIAHVFGSAMAGRCKERREIRSQSCSSRFHRSSYGSSESTRQESRVPMLCDRSIPLVLVVLACLGSMERSLAGEGQGSAAKPSASNERAAANHVWLGDLSESGVRVGWGHLGKHGNAGFENVPIALNGIPSPHGLGAHPDSTVGYQLDKKYRTFRAAAAVNDSTGGFERPVIFRIEADGKAVWQSRGMNAAHDCQPVMLDITGVERLTLKTLYDPNRQGNGGRAHVVWIEPYVSSAAPDAGLVHAFESPKFERSPERERLVDLIRSLLYRDKFADLEQMAKDIQAKHDIFDGSPRMHWFYIALTRPLLFGEHEQTDRLDHLAHWHQAKPKSAIPQIASAIVWLDMARTIGEGGSRPPGEQGWRLFRERIARAGECVLDAEELESKDPELLAAKIALVANQEWPSERIDALLDDALDIDPHYSPAYLARAATLVPRRGGKSGDIGRFADRMKKRLGSHDGEIAFTQIALIAIHDNPAQYHGDEFKSDELKPALLAYCREFAGSRSLVQDVCRLACDAGDSETARAIFDMIPLGDFDGAVWSSAQQMEQWRSKVNAQAPVGQ